MTNNSFNDSTFNALKTVDSNYIYNPSLSIVFTVLNQRSDDSRKDAVNHNCLLDPTQRPFTWTYCGDHRVITFPMYKASTGWGFYLDIEENGAIYISEGKFTYRTPADPKVLNCLRPSVKRQINAWLEALCCGTDGYGIVALCNSTCPVAVETRWHKLIKDYRTEHISYKLYRHLECGGCSNDFMVKDGDYSDIVVINEGACIDGDINNTSKMIISVSEIQHSEEDGYFRYVELIHNNSLWSQECLLNPGSIMFIRNENGEYIIDRDSEEDWDSYPGIPVAKKIMKSLAEYEEGLEDPDNTKLLGFLNKKDEGSFVSHWSRIPEEIRPHIFLDYKSENVVQKASIEVPTLCYDDISEIRMFTYKLGEGNEVKEYLLNSMGQVEFAHDHDRDFSDSDKD